jgi:hypothetical protein
MVTALIVSDLIKESSSDRNRLRQKLLKVATYLPDRAALPADRKLAAAVKEYKKAGARGTAQTGQREIRQRKFLELVEAL